jgi:hypothetical protein
LYPNPAGTAASLYFENPESELYSLSVFSISGKEVLPVQNTSGNEFSIPAGRLSAGMYFLRLTNSVTGISAGAKFVVE